MKKEELELPKFRQSGNYFTIIFKRPQDLEEKLTRLASGIRIDLGDIKNVDINVPKNVPNNVGINVDINVGRSVRIEIIFNKLNHNQNFTIKSLAKELKVTEKTIERDLEILKKENKIIFVGSKKSGRWKLVE